MSIFFIIIKIIRGFSKFKNFKANKIGLKYGNFKKKWIRISNNIFHFIVVIAKYVGFW